MLIIKCILSAITHKDPFLSLHSTLAQKHEPSESEICFPTQTSSIFRYKLKRQQEFFQLISVELKLHCVRRKYSTSISGAATNPQIQTWGRQSGVFKCMHCEIGRFDRGRLDSVIDEVWPLSGPLFQLVMPGLGRRASQGKGM